MQRGCHSLAVNTHASTDLHREVPPLSQRCEFSIHFMAFYGGGRPATQCQCLAAYLNTVDSTGSAEARNWRRCISRLLAPESRKSLMCETHTRQTFLASFISRLFRVSTSLRRTSDALPASPPKQKRRHRSPPLAQGIATIQNPDTSCYSCKARALPAQQKLCYKLKRNDCVLCFL